MPRRSAASLAISAPPAVVNRLQPPATLSPSARAEFLRIVTKRLPPLEPVCRRIVGLHLLHRPRRHGSSLAELDQQR
jgi:hypothetical protein